MHACMVDARVRLEVYAFRCRCCTARVMRLPSARSPAREVPPPARGRGSQRPQDSERYVRLKGAARGRREEAGYTQVQVGGQAVPAEAP